MSTASAVLFVCYICLFLCLFMAFVCCFRFFWWQLGLDDGSAVDKQVLLSWTGSSRSGQVSAASPDRTGFARTERVQVRRTKQVADFASWENVAAAAAVADFPSLVLLEAAAVQASHITSYAHRSARHGAPVPALHMPRPVPARPPPPPPPRIGTCADTAKHGPFLPFFPSQLYVSLFLPQLTPATATLLSF